MYTTNARDLIKGAAKLFGGLAQGEVPTADMENDAFAILNQMIDEWATQPWTSYTWPRTTFSWPSSTASRTIGATGNFTTIARPERIVAAFYILPQSPSIDVFIDVLMWEQYTSLPIKSLTNLYPTGAFYEPTSPDGTLYYWPIPSTSLTVGIYTEAPLAQFADLTTTTNFPPGYANALKYNLSVLLAPEWGLNLPEGVERYADLYLGRLKRANLRMSTMPNRWNQAFTPGLYDIFSDTVR